MIDENLIFIILITIIILFIITKYPKFILTILFIIIIYYIYKRNFTNPKEFILYIKNKAIETFESCNSSNMAYCDNDGNRSNMTFLPSIVRSALPNNDSISISNNINDPNNITLKLEDYTIDKRVKFGKEEITSDMLISKVPLLLDYKLYLDKLIKFVLNIKTDDNIQKDFLAKKLCSNMTKLFYNAYNTVTNKIYPINTYNDLIYSQMQFIESLNILTFLGLTEYDDNKINEFGKEFNAMNKNLNKFIIEKVNDITPSQYNITTSFLPRADEPLAINSTSSIRGISSIVGLDSGNTKNSVYSNL
jgi:hypothetical protein